MRIVGKLTGSFARKIGPSVLDTNNLSGLSSNEITEHFKQFDSVGDIGVNLSPFWVQSTPSRDGAIEVIVDADS